VTSNWPARDVDEANRHVIKTIIFEIMFFIEGCLLT
jgi:hypothetical protein